MVARGGGSDDSRNKFFCGPNRPIPALIHISTVSMRDKADRVFPYRRQLSDFREMGS